MCYRCVEKRGDLSHYQSKVIPFRRYFLLEREARSWHDTEIKAVCECGSETFGAAINNSDMMTGGKWVMQCLNCKTIHILEYMYWEAVEMPRIVLGVEGQS